MNYYLAVDAGGTKTDYVVADEVQVLARVRGGTLKRMRTTAETAAAHLDRALAELAATAGVPMSIITCTCIGTAGHTVPLVTDWLRSAFAERVSGTLILFGDVEIALDAAFPGQPGILVLAGTGSNVAGRDALGALSSAGGWGPALADQGSGHRISQQALRALFRAIDEGGDEQPPTALLHSVLRFWRLNSVDEIVAFANANPSPDFSKLAEIVLNAAEEGDEIARSVLEDEGRELASLVCFLVRRMRRASSAPSFLPPIAFAGSIMANVPPVRNALIAAVEREFHGIAILDGVVDPILGALWRARRGH